MKDTIIFEYNGVKFEFPSQSMYDRFCKRISTDYFNSLLYENADEYTLALFGIYIDVVKSKSYTKRLRIFSELIDMIRDIH